MTDQEDLTWLHPLFINDCDVGWSCDENSGKLIPAAPIDESNKVIYAIKKTKAHSFAFNLGSEDFHKILRNIFTRAYHFIDAVVEKNENVYKFMDFLIENHASNGYISFIESFSSQINLKEMFSCSPNSTHLVQTVEYGLQMLVVFNKKYNNLFDTDNIAKFLEKILENKQEMTDEQKKIECSVLVFSLDATKTNVFKMSMKEILKFIEEYQNGSHREYERHLYYALKKISVNSGISENFLNDARFDRLSYLIFEAYWHKKFLETEILPLNLKPVAAKGGLSAEFPSNQLEEMMNGLKIEEKTKKQIIVMNKSDFYNLDWEVVLLLKMDVVLSNDVCQPFVKTQDSHERILLGFGFHQNRTKPNKTEGSEIFVSPCPLECTINDRQWICINCGEFFRADGLQMICSCGRTHVANLKFECFDSNHPKEFFDDGTF